MRTAPRQHADHSQALHRRATGASLVVVVLAVVAFAGVMLLHALRSDVDPFRQVLSEYANGSHGRIMTAVFYAFGLASVALGLRLGGAIRRLPITTAVRWLLGVAGTGMVAAGMFEVERPDVPDTAAETIHSWTSVGAFVAIISAMLLFSAACRMDARWRSYRWMSTGLAALAVATAVATPLTDGSAWSGAVQRLLGGTILLWLLLTAVRLRRNVFSRRGGR